MDTVTQMFLADPRAALQILHMAGTQDSKATQAATFRVEAGGGGFVLPRLTVGLFLVTQDAHRIAIGSDRSRHVPLAAGEGWILPSGSDGLCEFDDAHSWHAVQVGADLLADAGLRHAGEVRPIVGTIDPLLAALVQNLASIEDDPGALYRETMDLAIAAQLARVLQPAPQGMRAIADHRLRRAIAYIHDNLAQNISLDALASEAAMSRYHFARAFTKALGQSPLQYVIAARMERAKLRLKTLAAPVSDIAASVGYDDVSRFSRHFQRHAGTTPARYREH